MGFCWIIIDNFHAKNEKNPAHRFRAAHTFMYFSYQSLIAITVTMFDFLKIKNMAFCCTIISKFHEENEKDLRHRFRPAHTFLYFSSKLSIMIANKAAILQFLKFEILVFVVLIQVSFMQKIKKKFLVDFGPGMPDGLQGVSDNLSKIVGGNNGATQGSTFLYLGPLLL